MPGEVGSANELAAVERSSWQHNSCEAYPDDHARRRSASLQGLAAERESSKTIPFRLHQNAGPSAMLVHSTPKIMLDAIALQKRFTQELFVPQLRLSSF
jgi:hypothetical protein